MELILAHQADNHLKREDNQVREFECEITLFIWVSTNYSVQYSIEKRFS